MRTRAMEKQKPEWKDPWDPVFLEAVRQLREKGEHDADAGSETGAEAACTEESRKWAAGRTGVGKRLVAASQRRQNLSAVTEMVGAHRWRGGDSMFSQEGTPVAAGTAPHGLLTTIYDGQPSSPTWDHDQEADDRPLEPLVTAYRNIREGKRLQELAEFPLLEFIGQGGQGVVFRTECGGSDGFAFPAAVKVFSPERFPSVRSYEDAMGRSARIASSVAAAYHGNVVGIQGFRQDRGVRIMLMDLVDGYDLQFLLRRDVCEHVRRNASAAEWHDIENVVLTEGEERPRLLPGAAVFIVRDVLMGLASLHRLGIVHGDIKPANIMLKRCIGRAEIVDLGSAFDLCDPPTAIIQTPAYAAPEAMAFGVRTSRSDVVSLGYVTVELMAGKQIFRHDMTSSELMNAKRRLPNQLRKLLPARVSDSVRLMRFLEKMVAFRPEDRFASADDADLDPECGASAFLTELAQGRLSAVYENDIRHWLDIVRLVTRPDVHNHWQA